MGKVPPGARHYSETLATRGVMFVMRGCPEIIYGSTAGLTKALMRRSIYCVYTFDTIYILIRSTNRQHRRPLSLPERSVLHVHADPSRLVS